MCGFRPAPNTYFAAERHPNSNPAHTHRRSTYPNQHPSAYAYSHAGTDSINSGLFTFKPARTAS